MLVPSSFQVPDIKYCCYLGPLASIVKKCSKLQNFLDQNILQEHKYLSKPSWKFSMHTEGFWTAFRNEELWNWAHFPLMPFISPAEAPSLSLLLSAKDSVVAIQVSTQLGHRQRSAQLTSLATYGSLSGTRGSVLWTGQGSWQEHSVQWVSSIKLILQ